MSSESNFEIIPFPAERRLITDIGAMSSNRPSIRGLLEINIAKPMDYFQEYRKKFGEKLSFSAFLISCLGQAVEKFKSIQAYRNWRGQLVVFEDVDVATMIEVERDGKCFPVGYIVRAANKKSFPQIHKEIRSVQSAPLGERNVKKLSRIGQLPGLARRLVLKWIELDPHRIKRYKGTVILTSVGMFGNAGGFGISLPTHSLGITVGGISKKLAMVGDRIKPQEHLNITLDFDHNIVDGAPAARFAARFQELVESGAGLV